MNRALTTWMLGGALAASLTWNWAFFAKDESSARCATGETCASPIAAELDLDDAQQRALSELCERSCRALERLERSADERQSALLASLADPAVDGKAAQDLVREVSELRRRSLEACVDGILEVRKLLTPEQIAALLGRCDERATSCR